MEKIACLEIDLPPKMKATKVVWGALNEKLIVSYADGTIRTFDPYDGTELEYAQVGLLKGRLRGLGEGGREGGKSVFFFVGRLNYCEAFLGHYRCRICECLAYLHLNEGKPTPSSKTYTGEGRGDDDGFASDPRYDADIFHSSSKKVLRREVLWARGWRVRRMDATPTWRECRKILCMCGTHSRPCGNGWVGWASWCARVPPPLFVWLSLSFSLSVSWCVPLSPTHTRVLVSLCAASILTKPSPTTRLCPFVLFFFYVVQVHSKDINRLCINKDRTLLLTCSKDYTSKLLDANTLQVLSRPQVFASC